MDPIGSSSMQTPSAGEIIAGFVRREPAVAAAFGPLAEASAEVKRFVEDYLSSFLLQARRLPQFGAEEAQRLVHHEASRDHIIVGELVRFPDRYEPAINDIGRLIYRQERAGRGPIKDLALYLLARLARLYRVEAERREGIPAGAFNPAKHLAGANRRPDRMN